MWEDLIPQGRYKVVEEKHLPGCQAKYLEIPHTLNEDIRIGLRKVAPMLYAHQARAIDAFISGNDICLSTSTASGKSLVFMTCATHRLFSDNLSKCLVLYPAKALIMDQLQKWEAWGRQFDIRIGYIHGEVATKDRVNILLASRVVLMTPDVAHAWLMSNLSDNRVRRFMEKLDVLVLDEAHVYEGVFGSNMAHFMRRVSAIAAPYQLILTTATLGLPEKFALGLTGRNVVSFSREDDTAQIADKDIVLITEIDSDTFQCKVDLLMNLRNQRSARFLAFADSRRMVEQLTVAVNRGYAPESEDEDGDDGVKPSAAEEQVGDVLETVLPYRSGYEDHDRNRIQKALSEGRLAGVVSTSALELGLDIGELEVVVLLGVPATVKSFWQRVGRVGRKKAGKCIMVDSGCIVPSVYGGLEKYLARPLEPNWLYLHNRKIQYANALCAAAECQSVDKVQGENSPFSTLPKEFREYLLNELEPTKAVEPELLAMKQAAQDSPQYAFPIRSSMDQNFTIKQSFGNQPLGTITFTQALREAYPGAIYYYMAKPFRVQQFKIWNREIVVVQTRRFTTRPISRSKVFPDFFNGTKMAMRCNSGFVVETDMQVSEQVLGFEEKRGPNKSENLYELGSPYHNKPLNRFFATTGVCWQFDDARTVSSSVAAAIFYAYSTKFGIDPRDISYGSFHAKSSPFANDPIQGMTVYDTTDGSLRLTQKLAENFCEVVQAALALANAGDARVQCTVSDLNTLLSCAEQLEDVTSSSGDTGDEDKEWVTVIANDQNAMYLSKGVSVPVIVKQHIYTQQGLKYRLLFRSGSPTRIVPHDSVQPLYGETAFIRFNLATGEDESME